MAQGAPILGSAPSPTKQPASPPVALARLRICAPTRVQVGDRQLVCPKAFGPSFDPRKVDLQG